ncbi:hypothetical protein [Mycobacterium marinum]|uniref:hypothetical protein n=1 Tax=Mycobacterium marinum TaxID=1781 RepID=UPI00233FFC3C|nr:hypothetical protein [Mycobacterium marinum]MDC8982733.1 hypothetical protein [Mycobacterium marinum]MDC8993458.1 hypothetical protein [Mycobacterium marinum]MDC8999442.1 hypothetical protein [Mycobacterium marinum]MDC9010095.1 hypothetical protein [Mycobacterium marinum]MDC9014959.1 hypothetical protein [Mycobacterium marinum]
MEKNLGKLLDHAPEQGVEEPCCSVPDIGTIWVRRATREELPELYALIKREVGDVASFEVLERVFNKNADSVWAVYRSSDDTRADAELIGSYAFLHLNQAGLERLESGTFDGRDPDLGLIVGSGTQPAALYVWVMLLTVRGISRIVTWLFVNAAGAETLSAPMFTTAATTDGVNAAQGYGFLAQGQGGVSAGQLYRVERPERAVGVSNSVRAVLP